MGLERELGKRNEKGGVVGLEDGATAPDPASARNNHLASIGLLNAVREGRDFLRIGAASTEVSALQNDINDWIRKEHPKGITSVPEDGLFDKRTYQAVQAFQLAHAIDLNTGQLKEGDDKHHLLEDGIVGPRTMRALDLYFRRAQAVSFEAFKELTGGYWDISQVDEKNRWKISDAGYDRKREVTPFVERPRKEDKLPLQEDQAAQRRLREITQELGAPPNSLLAVLGFETIDTFSTTIRNRSTGAVGLLQWLPSTLKGMGYTADEVAHMNRMQQIELMREYFLPYKGKLHDVYDVYAAVLYPVGVSRPDDAALFSSGSRAYAHNRNLDGRLGDGKDGVVTKREAGEEVRKRMERYNRLFGDAVETETLA